MVSSTLFCLIGTTVVIATTTGSQHWQHLQIYPEINIKQDPRFRAKFIW